MNLRKDAFRAFDALRGGQIASELREIIKFQSPDAGNLRDRLLEEQLAYVSANVPFYRKFERSGNLSDFPVIDKGVVRDNSHSMLSDEFQGSRLHVASTSGSTGIPFQVRHDQRKRIRSSAETILYGSAAGYEIGTRLYHLKIWSGRNRRSRPVQAVRNLVPMDVLEFRDEEADAFLRQLERSRRPFSIISYASALETVAKRVASRDNRRGKPSCAQAIIAQSEALPDEARKVLSEWFGLSPVSRYGLEELGIVAQQLPGDDQYYIVNRATFLLEILKLDKDEPVAGGETGRIVVTDLINKAQPLVRYDTGDLGAWVARGDGSIDQSRLRSIEGRRLDRIYDVQDRPISSWVAYRFFWRYPEIRQYQIVQRDQGDYLLRLNVSSDFERERDFAEDFRKVVGTDAIIEIERSEVGYVLSSGKRKPILSYYTPKTTFE